MIRNSHALDRPGPIPTSARERELDEAAPGFALELEQRSARLERDHEEPPEPDDPNPQGALMQAPPATTALPHALAAARAVRLGGAHAPNMPTAALPEGAPPDGAPATLAVSAEATLDARLAAVLSRDLALSASASSADAPLCDDDLIELDLEAELSELVAELDADPGEELALGLRHAKAPEPPARPVQLDPARPLADQVADAVQRLAAEVSDRPDVMRFRGPDFSFAAVVRQDGHGAQLRLLSDDPATRLLLGERLPEVRQALERVGFPAGGVSVGAEGERQHHSRHDPDAPPDDSAPAPPTVSSPAPSPAPAPAPGATASRNLHLIL